MRLLFKQDFQLLIHISKYKKVGDLLGVDFGVSIVVELQNRTPKNGDIEVGFGAKQLTKGDWGNKLLERHDQMGKEWLLELVTLDDNTLNIADPGDKIEEAIFFKSQSLLLPAEKRRWRPLGSTYSQLSTKQTTMYCLLW